MRKYVDSCRTYEILLQDSGLLPKPKEDWNTFIPKKGDLAIADNFEYEFDGVAWVKVKAKEFIAKRDAAMGE